MNTLRKIAANFDPEINKALLFVEVLDTERDLKLLLTRLEGLVKRKLDYEVFEENNSVITLVRLIPQEAREATVMLGETGISNLIVLFPQSKLKKKNKEN